MISKLYLKLFSQLDLNYILDLPFIFGNRSPAVADLRGRQGCPRGQNSFIYRQKNCKIIPIWELAHPPRENPGSATVRTLSLSQKKPILCDVLMDIVNVRIIKLVFNGIKNNVNCVNSLKRISKLKRGGALSTKDQTSVTHEKRQNLTF